MGAMGTIIKHLKMQDEEAEYYDGEEFDASEGCQEVSDEEEMLSEGMDFVSETYSGVSQRVSKMSAKSITVDHTIPNQAEWQYRSLSKAALARKFDPFGVIVTLTIGGVAVATTINGLELNIQIMMWMTTIMLALVTNPMHAVEKILALPSRWMIAISLFMIDLAINVPSKNMIIAAVLVTLILMSFTKIGNKGWIIEETYLATEFTRKAQDFDCKDLPYLSWRAHGKRETWTAIEQAGLVVSEHDINLGYRIAYRVGHLNGMTMVEANNRNKTRMEARIQELEDYIEEHSDDIELAVQVKGENLQLRGQIDDLKIELKRAQDEAESNEVLAEDWEKKAYEYKDTIVDLNRQIKDISEHGIAKEGMEDLIVRMLKAGVSYRKIEAVTGQNKLLIGDIRKKYNIELPSKQEA